MARNGLLADLHLGVNLNSCMNLQGWPNQTSVLGSECVPRQAFHEVARNAYLALKGA
jgi:hypothetical protein